MTDHSKATPRPWKWEQDDEVYDIRSDYTGLLIACVSTLTPDIDKANISLIVEAVNSHDRLVEENKRLREALRELAGGICTCDTDEDEFGNIPLSENGNAVNYYGEAVWGDVCPYCIARAALEG